METQTPTESELDSERDSALQTFEDYDHVMSIINTVISCDLSEKAMEILLQEFKRLFDKYLEQPYLLDGHLEQIVRTLIEPIRSAGCPEAVLQKCLIFLQVPTSVRGYKAVVHHLPHEISDIEPVLQLLERVTPIQTACHPTVNMLLLWLSVVSIVPFQLSRLDSGDGFNKSIAERILSIVKVHLSSGGQKTVAPALLAANFITRPDIVDVHLDDFFAWIQETIDPANAPEAAVISMLATLARVFKLANRDVLCKHAKSLLTLLAHKCIKANPNIVVRKLSMKLFQRIGQSYLPANLAPWRHLRRVKQLVDGLNADASRTEPAFPSMKENTNFEVPPIIEEVVDKLLEGLVDEGLNVRWSAAKGIGRIASRLPKEMASEVVSSIFSQFEAQIENTSWHGGCLALAELGRRGTLLPEHLPQVVDAVVKSLVFDECWGKCAIGSLTRDAACYVTWTLGRSYDPGDIAPFVSSLATTLICVALFDRELNCRRAAAAAFQECVGRLGTFPHGISIISIVSYFSLSRIQTSYLSVSLQVADFPEYSQHLILHLINEKVGHWDRNIRLLCSQALFKLTAKDPHFMIDTCVPKLLAAMSNHDGSVKHGTVLSLAEVVHALSIWAREREKDIEDILGPESVLRLMELPSILEKDRAFLGIGNASRGATCFLIEKLARAHFCAHSAQPVLESWLSIIEACLRWDDKTLRCQACSSLSVFMEEYYGGDEGVCERIVGTYIENLRSPTEGVRSNFAQALGALPSFMHRAYQVPILEGLCLCASSEGYEHVESRKEAVLALSRFYISVGAGGAAGVPDLGRLVAILLRNMEDYSQSPMKGDLGALVRKACMTAFKDVVCYFASVAPEILPENFVAEMMRALAQQCVEPVDNLRGHATETFISILYSKPDVPHIPHRDEAREILPEDIGMRASFLHAGHTFPYWSQFLSLRAYREPLLRGFLVSTGSMSEALFSNGRDALVAYLLSIHGDKEQEELVYFDFFLPLFLDKTFVHRALLQYLNALDHLVTSGAFADAPSEFLVKLQSLVALKGLRLKAIPKVEAAVGVLSSLLQFEGDCRKGALINVLKTLDHRSQRVRITTAARLGEALLMYTVLEGSRLDDALRALSSTDWRADRQELKRSREILAVAFGLGELAP
ncbi:hypothetical protein HPB47_025191 [Ixodes persulcatus]|uniref:Uncharacterized protein n=1 Tax=Ixodes persulcatus TaxID=34615 RepID=A0AC60Q278_IXOPE|nr:hypothetical protein HPB47_025191 [Ixodes persulcatus]